MERPYPLLFEPILKPRVWGGRALADLGKHLPAGEAIGESWEIADLPDSIPGGRTRIRNGPLAGLTLREAIEGDRAGVLGAAKLTPEGGFPLLVKYLDARRPLSVQVHPTPAYAERHPGSFVKSEAWYIVRAEPGSVLYLGLRPGVSREDFARHLREGTVEDDLVTVPARAGDCHYLPSGLCHALGGGILVAEIQTPSDTTFRVHDWGRQGRELHFEQALECIDFGPAAYTPPAPQPPFECGGIRSHALIDTASFAIERIDIRGRSAVQVVTNEMPEIWMLLDGRGQVHMERSPPVDMARGDSALMPAGIGAAELVLDGPATVLRTTLPSPLTGLIA